MRPVELDLAPHRAAEQFVDRNPQAARLDVQQRVLDGADRLLHDAAQRLPANGVHIGDDGFGGAGVPADQQRRDVLDHRRQASAAERLVVFAPADQAAAGRDLDEIEVARAGIRMQAFDRGDVHVRTHLCRSLPDLNCAHVYWWRDSFPRRRKIRSRAGHRLLDAEPNRRTNADWAPQLRPPI